MRQTAELRLPPCLLAYEDRTANPDTLRTWYAEHRPDAILTDVPEVPALPEQMGVRVPEDLGLATLTVLDCPIEAGIYQNPEEIGSVLAPASLAPRDAPDQSLFAA